MKFPNLKKGDKVDITWDDVYDPELPSWADDDQIEKAIEEANTTAESRGYYYCEEDGYIYICGDILYPHYSRLTGIPKGCIIKLKKEKK